MRFLPLARAPHCWWDSAAAVSLTSRNETPAVDPAGVTAQRELRPSRREPSTTEGEEVQHRNGADKMGRKKARGGHGAGGRSGEADGGRRQERGSKGGDQ